MQISLEWGALVFALLTMIGNLFLFFAARHAAAQERQNIAEQVRLYRRIQLENRLIDTVSEDIRTLLEIAYAIDGLQNERTLELQEKHRFRVQQLASTLTRLSWRSGPFTDEVARIAIDAHRVGVGAVAPANMPEIVEDADKLSKKLEAWLKAVLTEEM